MFQSICFYLFLICHYIPFILWATIIVPFYHFSNEVKYFLPIQYTCKNKVSWCVLLYSFAGRVSNIFPLEHDCDRNAKCLNTEGSFYCECKAGYYTGPCGKQCYSKLVKSLIYTWITLYTLILGSLMSMPLSCKLVFNFNIFFFD